MNNFGFYLVMTRPLVGYEHCADAAIRAEVPMLQLRMKDVPREEILTMAKRIQAMTRGTKTTFILNDDPELAAEVSADGVHLGQTDMSIVEARARYPQLRYFGLSTHNLEQLNAALSLSPDYVGVGPVYKTPTKSIPDPTLGIDQAQQMLKRATVPAVAIGGIDLKTLPEIQRLGAQNFAVVRAVCASPTPYRAILEIMNEWNRLQEACK